VKLKFKPGDTVRVIGSRRTAKIRAILTSMHGALLETQIEGFRRWNLDELRLVKRSQKKNGQTVGAYVFALALKDQAAPSEPPVSEKHSDKAKNQKAVGKPKN